MLRPLLVLTIIISFGLAQTGNRWAFQVLNPSNEKRYQVCMKDFNATARNMEPITSPHLIYSRNIRFFSPLYMVSQFCIDSARRLEVTPDVSKLDQVPIRIEVVANDSDFQSAPIWPDTQRWVTALSLLDKSGVEIIRAFPRDVVALRRCSVNLCWIGNNNYFYLNQQMLDALPRVSRIAILLSRGLGIERLEIDQLMYPDLGE